MNKQIHILLGMSILCLGISCHSTSSETEKPKQVVERKHFHPTKKGKKKTMDERYAFTEARIMHEYYMQVNPITGTIPEAEKKLEIKQSEQAPRRQPGQKATPGTSVFTHRGPSNLGGRTRAIVFDRSDASNNTILAGGISGGVFRTTDSGNTWTKVSPFNSQHNVTSIAQDPRAGFQNIWYYSTGEALGNSASDANSFYTGHGVWRSADNGLTWTQLPLPAGTNNEFTFDHRFDLISRIAVHPTTGDLFAAAIGCIFRWDISANAWVTEVTATGTFGSGQMTDVVISTTGRVYAAFAGVCPAAQRGIWTSSTATGATAGTWTRIATNGTPAAWAQGLSAGRAVMAIAPSNQDLLYVLYDNGVASSCGGTAAPEAMLWRWNQGTSVWTNFSATLPNETGCSDGNDPFAIQGGYDLVVSVKPDNANFVVIGGTNVYRKTDITAAGTFGRIGGYANATGYALYTSGGDAHHPDIHALTFHPTNPLILWSGTDGGVHRCNDVTAATVRWGNRNNNYQTYQYYYVALDQQQTGSDMILGGAQDNGTTAGGISFGMPTATEMNPYFSGDGGATGISRADACTPFFFSTQLGSIYRDCPTFADITPTGSASDFVTYFHLDPEGGNTIYYSGQANVWRTNNAVTVNSGGWTNLGAISSIPPGGFTDYTRSYATTRGAYSTTNSYLFIGTDEGKIFRLQNPRNVANLNTAVNITPAGATTTFPSIVSQIAVHPTNPNIVLAVYSNYGIPSIFLTTNATAASPAWTLVERNISALSVRSAAITEVSGQILYFVGTTRGLYSSSDPTTSDWVLESPGTIGFSLVSHLVYRPSDNVLLVGTHGNGIFQTTILANLPVELASFTGKEVNRTAQLDWTTLVEINSQGFDIQRSADGVDFETIGFVPSTPGSESQERHYRFVDAEMPYPVQYYRLRQLDWDEKATLSDIVAIQREVHPDVQLAVYPNPIKDRFKLQFSEPINCAIEVVLYDALGKPVFRQTFDAIESLALVDIGTAGLPAGMYALQVFQDKMKIKTLMVQKL